LSLGVQDVVLQLAGHNPVVLYMSEPVVLHLEHIGAKVLAQAVTGAIFLLDPDYHRKPPLVAKTISSVLALPGARAVRPSIGG
jgi:hypothetical protein